MSSLDALDRMLRSLHRAMLDDAHWPAASALIDETCGVQGNGLAVGGGSGDDHRIYFAGIYRRGERRRDLEREYFDDLYARDERVPRLRKAPAGQLIHVPDLYSEEERRTSPVYNEGLSRLGGRNGLNVRFDGPDGLQIVWASSDPVATDGWQSSQLDLIGHLMPHVRQFVLVRQALAAADALGAGLTGLLDNRHVGVIQLDRNGRMTAANDAARDILQRDDGIAERGGVLGAWLPADNTRLGRLVAAALPVFGCGTPAGGSMTLRRRSGATRLRVHVSPVDVARADFGGRRVAAMVLVVDPARRPSIDPGLVAATLNLTPSEARVAALLAGGRSVHEVATQTGYREGYVRWLLKQAYKKNGLSGQVALVRLVLAADSLPRR